MFLTIQVQSSDDEIREILFISADFADCINALNALAAAFQIKAACLVDDPHKLYLPIEAFDGNKQDAANIVQLQQQWELILNHLPN